MRAAPSDVDRSVLATELKRGWGIRIAACDYVPVGGGSHHWRVADADGAHHWVTVDDLARKPYLGRTREDVLAALRQALRAAVSLHGGGGLEFVVAPRPTIRKEVLREVGSRYALALYPFLDATPLEFGQAMDAGTAREVAVLLARLHLANGSLSSSIRQADAELPGRPELERALRELRTPWVGGPFSEPARGEVAGHQGEISELLAAFDGLRERVNASGKHVVVTHGEPHPANLLRADGRLFLVDWDTLAADAAERDLWWLEGHPDALAEYEKATGRIVDKLRTRLFRLRWRLDDIASFVVLFRSPHDRNEDTERWWSFAGRMTSG